MTDTNATPEAVRASIVVGQRFGRLTVTAEVERHRQPSGVIRRRVACLCDCGNTMTAHLANLRSGHTASCGCAQREAGQGNATHRRTGTPEYRAWQDMIQRCYNPLRARYPLYGGRGITVCQRWRESFEAFLDDMGERPSRGHSIDRVDNDKGYCKENCRWATNKEQSRNNRRNVLLTINGETLCVSAWAEKAGIRAGMIWDRLRSGWCPRDAVMTPKGGRRLEA